MNANLFYIIFFISVTYTIQSQNKTLDSVKNVLENYKIFDTDLC